MENIEKLRQNAIVIEGNKRDMQEKNKSQSMNLAYVSCLGSIKKVLLGGRTMVVLINVYPGGM